ncbi:hypothetical protein, partial [Klebsiella aerogenes]|uniref:hypothetical protein n=1 Tax=Klebsiella aerogenes TaxID=548 RepID=UPI0019530FB0
AKGSSIALAMGSVWSGIRFLDPLCRACSHDGVWYKAILPGAEEAVRALMATGLYDRLAGLE